MAIQYPNNPVVVDAVGVLSAQDRALLEAGNKLLVDSIDVGRDYNKSMIGIASGAIPLYLGVLKLGLPDKYVPTNQTLVIWGIPVVFFLVSMLLFSLGYFPARQNVNINNIDGISDARTRNINRRRCYALAGFAFLAAGIIAGALAAFIH